jgi:hypothetical protein
MLAAVDHAANADCVADVEAGNLIADGTHATNNLVTRDRGIECPGPFGAHRVQIRVANTAISDLDLNIMRARLTPLNVERLQRLVRGISPVGFDSGMAGRTS